MTREEHLVFCVRCKNREFNPAKGLVCSLTKEIASFDQTCPNYVVDEKVPMPSVSPETLPPNHELAAALPENVRVQLRVYQDAVFACLGGLSGAILGALIWALISVSTKYQIGYMAMGVGLMAGFGVQFFGAGIDRYFGVIGAFFALFGCALGNLLSSLVFISEAQGISYAQGLMLLNGEVVINIFKESFSPMDVLFYAIAAYEGYKFAFRKVTPELLSKAASGEPVAPVYAKLRLPGVGVLFIILSVAGFMIFKNTSGPLTYFYDSGAKSATGEMKNGKEMGKWDFWYENGKPQIHGYFTDGKQDSSWEYFNEEGILSSKGTYRLGVKHGFWQDFYTNGQVFSEGKFVLGRKHGRWKRYYDDGQISENGLYIYDQPDSLWESFSRAGQLLSKGMFIDGKRIGAWTYWNADGSVSSEMLYRKPDEALVMTVWSDGKQQVKNGNGKQVTTYDDGKLRSAGMVKDGMAFGQWTTYLSNGNKQEVGEYRDNRYYVMNSWNVRGDPMVVNGEGKYRNYHDSDGSIAEEGMIKSGLRVGIWETYSMENQQLPIQKMNYLDGKADGLQQSFNDDGQVKVEGSFVAGLRDGEWKWYYDDGTVESVATFKADLKVGEQFFYDQSGNLLRSEIYENGKLVSSRLAP